MNMSSTLQLQKQNTGGKRCENRIQKWEGSEKKDAMGNPLGLLDKPDLTFDGYMIFGMVLSIGGTLLKIKFMVWLGCYMSLMCAANYRGSEDFRQTVSGILVSIVSLAMLYGNDPAPML